MVWHGMDEYSMAWEKSMCMMVCVVLEAMEKHVNWSFRLLQKVQVDLHIVTAAFFF